ncbi:MAG: N-acetyl sugar amidotransferase [Zetaproteobacteria bacterium]|nr:N-acetyl sugar amidotransferase [Zetaproteobacteria bacterium]
MIYCQICLQPNTRPNTVFLENGICPACNYIGLLQHVDWQERYEILCDLLSQFPRKKGQYHDCIIGVSGGKDSTRQALFIRDKLGLNPLLVSLSYPPEQVTQRGVDNLSNLIELGFDVVVSAPAPQTWRRLKQEGFRKFTNSFRSTEMALFASVPQIAIRYGIQLILWGENPGLQLGDMKTLGRTGYDGNNLRYMNTLSSGLDWMLEHNLTKPELIPYLYPEPHDFDKYHLQIVYLGWFLGDWSEVNNAMYASVQGLTIREDRVEKTADLYGVTALDEDFTPINQLIKYYKFGFGRVTDYVNEDIRFGRMTRARGIEVVTQYDDAYDDEYVAAYCEYLEITKDQFWQQVRQSVNRELFDIHADGTIWRKFQVGIGL